MVRIVMTGVLFLSALTAEDQAAPGAPNGIALSEFAGYETWHAVAPSQAKDGLKVTTANAAMINTYKEGFPANGKPVPDGAMFAKIEWVSKRNPESPYPVLAPDTLQRVGFMVKDSKRFRDTDGWGYAQWLYDSKSDTFKPEYTDSAFGKKVCHQCHTLVKAKDFVFTAYPKR